MDDYESSTVRRLRGGLAFDQAYERYTATSSDARALAILAACTALDIDPALSVIRELAMLAQGNQDVLDAVREMRNAQPYDRVTAALRLLRYRRGPTPIEEYVTREDP